MKKAFVFVVAAAVLAAVPSSARAAEPAVKEAIEHLNSEFVAAWNAHDAKKMAATWAEDGDLINPFGLKAHGRTGIEKFFEAEHAGVMKGTTYKVDSISVRALDANTAIADWDSNIVGMMDPSGKAMPPFHHHVTSVCEKKGGAWHAAAVRAFGFEQLPGAPAK